MSNGKVATIILLLVPLFEPGVISGISWLDWLNPVFALGKVATVVFLFVMSVKRGRFDAFSICIALFAGAALASAVICEESITTWIKVYVPYVAACLLVLVYKEDSMRELLWAILILTATISVLNFLSVFAFPGGMYNTGASISNDGFFWKNKNSAYQVILPSIASSVLIDYAKGITFSKRSVILIIIGFMQVVIAYSATSLVALVLLMVGLALIRVHLGYGFFNSFTYIAVYMIVFIFLIFSGVDETAGSIFERLLGRSADLTNRSIIWDWVFHLMDADHVLWGHGFNYDLLTYLNSSFVSAHNLLLHLWYTGGYISIVLFTFAVFFACFQMYKRRVDRAAYILSLVFGCFLAIGLVEAMLCVSFFLILALGNSVTEIEELRKKPIRESSTTIKGRKIAYF